MIEFINRSLWRCLFILIFITAPGLTMDYGETLANPGLEKRAKYLYAQIRCPTCVNQSIMSSNSQEAQDLRAEVRQQLLLDTTDEMIIKGLQDHYGAAIIYDPDINLQTWILWGLPFILIIIGTFIFIIRYRQRFYS